jgi:hypothetical protein
MIAGTGIAAARISAFTSRRSSCNCSSFISLFLPVRQCLFLPGCCPNE